MGNYTKNLFKRGKLWTKAAEPTFEETFDDEVVVTSALDSMVPIKLWIDDARSPGQGWTWVKSMHEALDLFDENENYMVSHMAVDYYMDHDNKGAPNGAVVAHELIMRMHYLGRPHVFAKTLHVNCHSSDRAMRIKTAKVIQEAQADGYLNQAARITIQPV